MPSDIRSRRHRRLYPVLIEIGLIASLLIVIGAFRFNYRIDRSIDFTPAVIDPVTLVPIVPTDITPKPPPPPRPPVPVVVPDDEELVDDVIAIDQNIDITDPVTVTPPPPPPPATNDVDPGIFIVVEDYPQPIGGMEGIMRRLVYPEIARKAGIQGRVVVQFVIEKDGTVSNAEVLKGIGGGCDEAALEALLGTPFTPGMQRKKPVRVKMTIPIVFRLND